MTREGYTHICVPAWLKNRLLEIAKANGLSVPALINLLLKSSSLFGSDSGSRFRPSKRELIYGSKQNFERVEFKSRLFVRRPELEAFESWLVGEGLSKSYVVRTFRPCFRAFMSRFRLEKITEEDLKLWVAEVENPNTKAYRIKFLKHFFRWLGREDLVAGLKYPPRPFNPPRVPSRKQLQEFFEVLNRSRVLFLLLASSGLRRGEAFNLRASSLNFEMDKDVVVIYPEQHAGITKRSWITFANSEAKDFLQEYIKGYVNSRSEPIFPPSKWISLIRREWGKAAKKTGIKINPHLLRKWFCTELATKGVPSHYIDAFCGRVPQTILARHYTDYSPQKLLQIYKQANLKVLS